MVGRYRLDASGLGQGPGGAVVKTVMNLQNPQGAGNLWTS
jgi:hypothetical protein